MTMTLTNSLIAAATTATVESLIQIDHMQQQQQGQKQK
jgi:hypothetical protein